MYNFFERISNIDPGFYLVIGLCFLALWPFISRSSLPQETDAELHIYRLAELSRLAREGDYYPRWSPNFYYGFGYPIFNYYAPLSYYIGLGVDFLPTLGPVDGIKVGFILGLLGAAIGMYGYSRDNWGRSAGLVAAASFVFAPYVLFIDPHARGDVAESLSLGFFALSLWALDRVRRRPGRLPWIASILAVSGLILSHNLMSVIFVGLLAAWGIWQIIVHRMPLASVSSNRGQSKLWEWRLIGAIALSIGITAFFWLNIILEQDAVNLSSLVGQGGHFDFRSHFLSLTELFSPSEIIDWGATEPAFVFNLGIAQWLLAAVGLLMFAIKRSKETAEVAFFILILIVLIFLMLPVSSLLWSNIPYMDFIQFPWRLLGPTSAVLAIIAGSGFGALESILAKKVRPWALASVITFIVLTALPLMQAPPWPGEFGPTSTVRVLEIEMSGRWLGTTSTADFVPATVDIIPRPEPSMVDDYQMGRTVDRVNRKTLPADTSVDIDYLSPNHMRFQVEGSSPFLLRLFTFYFPGWQARIDGERVDIEIGRPEGFIVVPIPEGSHQVDVQFGLTASRIASFSVSLAFLILTGLITWRLPYKGNGGSSDRRLAENGKAADIAPAAIALLLIFALQLVGGDRYGWFHRQSRNVVEDPAVSSTNISFVYETGLSNEIRLIGYKLGNQRIQKGEELKIDLYWKAAKNLENNYQVFVHLLDENGDVIAQSDKLNPGDFPTERWPIDKYVLDEHTISFPDQLSNGPYRLGIGLWSAENGQRLEISVPGEEGPKDMYIIPELLSED